MHGELWAPDSVDKGRKKSPLETETRKNQNMVDGIQPPAKVAHGCRCTPDGIDVSPGPSQWLKNFLSPFEQLIFKKGLQRRLYPCPASSKQRSCSFWRTLIFQYLVKVFYLSSSVHLRRWKPTNTNGMCSRSPEVSLYGLSVFTTVLLQRITTAQKASGPS